MGYKHRLSSESPRLCLACLGKRESRAPEGFQGSREVLQAAVGVVVAVCTWCCVGEGSPAERGTNAFVEPVDELNCKMHFFILAFLLFV